MNKTLTQTFEGILPHSDICEYAISLGESDCDCWNRDIAKKLIQAVREYNQEVVGEDKHWSFPNHDCRECRGVNKRVHKIRQRQEELL